MTKVLENLGKTARFTLNYDLLFFKALKLLQSLRFFVLTFVFFVISLLSRGPIFSHGDQFKCLCRYL